MLLSRDNIFDEQHLNMFKLNNFPVDKAEDFVRYRQNKYMTNMVGMEYMIWVINWLAKNGATNIINEIPIKTHLGETSIDIQATINGEENLFECKCTEKIRAKKVIKQLRKYRTLDKKTHLVTPKDCSIGPETVKTIQRIGVEIDRTPFTQEDIIKTLLNMQRLCRKTS